ncbi:cholestenol delta-isomerase [Podospora fimiseda]|uniref:Cholestenol delta-isomerase n=1 Tax=Podospora fimiseda TaxID=252190 RepID=A0AAN7BY48_9PEZI|nr:cholestenol delta-isomerase [Podospora fimiseda]
MADAFFNLLFRKDRNSAQPPLPDPTHPYFPRNLSLPTYSPNTWTLPLILSAFISLITLFVGSGLLLARYKSPLLKNKLGDQFTIAWFLLCGFLHLFFEGYLVFFSESIPSSQFIFSQLWKEYSLSDSRYISRDPFMHCIESLTFLIWGPLSLLTAYFIASNKQQGTRHILQIIVSVGHLYGVALYYGTGWFSERYEGKVYSRPEIMYFWVYYAGLNAPWGIVPVWLLWRSGKEVKRVFEVVDEEKKNE